MRGVREHGKSRIASSILKYASNSLPIILRAMRDVQPLKFFGGIALLLGVVGLLSGGFMCGWYIIHKKTTPFTSLISVSGIFTTLAFLLGVLALLADMLGRQRRITEELLYLARKRAYQQPRLPRLMLQMPEEPLPAVAGKELYPAGTQPQVQMEPGRVANG